MTDEKPKTCCGACYYRRIVKGAARAWYFQGTGVKFCPICGVYLLPNGEFELRGTDTACRAMLGYEPVSAFVPKEVDDVVTYVAEKIRAETAAEMCASCERPRGEVVGEAWARIHNGVQSGVAGREIVFAKERGYERVLLVRPAEEAANAPTSDS